MQSGVVFENLKLDEIYFDHSPWKKVAQIKIYSLSSKILNSEEGDPWI